LGVRWASEPPTFTMSFNPLAVLRQPMQVTHSEPSPGTLIEPFARKVRKWLGIGGRGQYRAAQADWVAWESGSSAQGLPARNKAGFATDRSG